MMVLSPTRVSSSWLVEAGELMDGFEFPDIAQRWNTEGVATEGGVGMTVLDRGDGFLLGLSSFGFLRRRWLDRRVEVPRWRGEVPEGSCGVERVVTPSLVSSGGCQDGRYSSSSIAAPFICSTGFQR